MKRWSMFLLTLLTGVLLGAGLTDTGSTGAAGGTQTAYTSSMKILVDGEQANIQAYVINDTTYVRLVDVGIAVDFNVYWDGPANSVQVETMAPYLGKPSLAKQQQEDVNSVRQEIVVRTNEERTRRGGQALTVNTRLMEAAQVRAAELAATTTYAHTRPDGRSYTTVTDCPYMGENLHRIAHWYLKQEDMTLAEAAMDGWLNSSSHLANMLNSDVSEIGVGIAKGVNAKGEDAWYCVQLFMIDGFTVEWVDSPVIP